MTLQQMESVRVKRAGEIFLGAAQHVPADKAHWKPHPNATSAHEIVQHLAWANHFFAAIIQGQTPPAADKDPQVPFEQVLQQFQRSYESLAHTIAAVPDAHLQEKRQMPWGQVWKVQSLLMGGSLHIAYHWGQIGYLQLAWGDTTDYHLLPEPR